MNKVEFGIALEILGLRNGDGALRLSGIPVIPARCKVQRCSCVGQVTVYAKALQIQTLKRVEIEER
jgi:hypothetical protein